VRRGDPADNRPGERIVIPEDPAQIKVREVDLDHVRRSYLHHALQSLPPQTALGDADIAFLAAETRSGQQTIRDFIRDFSNETSTTG